MRQSQAFLYFYLCLCFTFGTLFCVRSRNIYAYIFFYLVLVFSMTDAKCTRGRRKMRNKEWSCLEGKIKENRVRKIWYGKKEWWRQCNMSARNRGRSTGRDVLPYKSACVWCTTINLNDLSPPRACFGIQEPQWGLLARQHRSSFGLLPLWNSFSH